jgi:lipoprotein-anchoring transpeptidase ErfK/SrfK
LIFSRRRLIGAAAAAVFVPGAARAQMAARPAEVETDFARRNVSSFAAQDWRDHFDDLGRGAIVCDTVSRALHFWSGDGTDNRIYPTSVPKSDELTKRGHSKVVRKKVGPDWTPTSSQRERFPDWTYMPPRPGQPARHPCDVPRLAGLPDPRHPRHAQDRAPVVGRLHRALQRRHRAVVRGHAG